MLKERFIMTYKSKRTLASMIVSTALYIGYIVYAIGKYQTDSGDIKSWAISMLIFIGISIVAQIVIQILFHIGLAIGIAVKEERNGKGESDSATRNLNSSMVEDEMDKLIKLKSDRVGYICAGIGFIVTLAAFAFGLSTVLAINILFGSFAVGTFIESGLNIYYFEKGVHNA